MRRKMKKKPYLQYTDMFSDLDNLCLDLSLNFLSLFLNFPPSLNRFLIFFLHLISPPILCFFCCRDKMAGENLICIFLVCREK